MRKASLAGRRAADGTTYCPARSIVPPKDAAAPLKLGAKKGSESISCFHEAANSGPRRGPGEKVPLVLRLGGWRSAFACKELYTCHGVSLSGAKARTSIPRPP
jgi:hypothetical protein